MIDHWLLPDPDDVPPDQINEYYRQKIYGGMDPEKGDKDNNVTPEEMEKIEKFLESINPLINPPND